MNVYGELIRAQLHLSASDLTPTATGLVYFNTTTGPKWYNGSTWLLAADTTTSQVFTNKDYDGGTASNTSRITVPKASKATLDALTRKEGTIVYGTDTDKLYADDGTTLVTIGSSSGAGELNAVLNASAGDSLTGWTDGTSHTTTRLTSGSPLDPVITTALNTSATTTATESSTSGAKYSITTMPTSLLSKKLKVEFYFTTEASQTWAVSVYASTTRLALSSDSSGATTLPAGVTGKFVAYFDTTTATAYSVNLTRTAGSGTAVLKFTSVIVGPGIQPQGSVVGPTEVDTGFSFEAFGTVSNQSIYRTRVGTRMFIQGNVQIGTATGSTAAMVLPTGITIDTTKLPALTNGDVVGYFKVASTATTSLLASNQTDGAIFFDGVTTNKLFFSFTGGTTARRFTNMTGTNFANDAMLSINLNIPIAEWAGSGAVNLAQNDVEYASNSSTSDANDTTSFVYGPSGSAVVGTLTTERTKRVRFTTPILATDKIEIEYNNGGALWVPIENNDYQNVVCSFQYQNAIGYGVGLSNSLPAATDIDVAFGRYYGPTGATYASAGGNWSSVAGQKWRVKKTSGGAAVGFGLASPTQSGLAPAGVFTSEGSVVNLQELTATPANTTSGADCKVYMKADKIVIAYNDGGTMRYKYLDLTGTGVTWVHTTTAP